VIYGLLSAAYQACRNNVDRVHLVGCSEDGTLLSELFTREGSGTLIMQDHSEVIRAATIDDVGGILDLISPLEQQGVLVKRSRELLETEISRFMVVVHPEGTLLGCAALYPIADSHAGELACVATHPNFTIRASLHVCLSALKKMPQTMGLQCYLYSLPKPLTGLESKVFPRQKSVHCQRKNSLSTIIMPKYRSHTTTQGRNMAGARALWRATGMKDDDFNKPMIAIANSYTQFVPGHVHLKDMGDWLQREIAKPAVLPVNFILLQ